MTHTPTRPRPPFHEVLVSIVLPVYNERQVLPELIEAIDRAMRSCAARWEAVFVDDGSTDASPEILDELAAQDERVRVVHLSRNFGHQAAVHAGLVFARGDVLVLMDSDLQDAPDAIPRFLFEWQAGYDVVYAVRTNRKEGLLKRLAFRAFYRLLSLISSTPIPLDAGIFGLIDCRVARQITGLIERDRYYAGLRTWVGFRQKGIEVERRVRYDGRPRVSLRGLFRLAKTAVFSFSTAPISMFYIIAGLALATFAGLGILAVASKIIAGTALAPWVSNLLVASFFGGLNALGLAILGDYVVRIYDQVRGRPLFIVDRTTNMQSTGVGQPSGAHKPDELSSKDPKETDVAKRAAAAELVGGTASDASDAPWLTGRAEDDADSLALLEQVSNLLDEASPSPASDPSTPTPS